jgi:hypothetical protein
MASPYDEIDAVLRSFRVNAAMSEASVTWGSGAVETVALRRGTTVSVLKRAEISGCETHAWIATGDAAVLCVRANEPDGWTHMGTVDDSGAVQFLRPRRRPVDPSREEDLARCTEWQD